jgi:hypothetical protein
VNFNSLQDHRPCSRLYLPLHGDLPQPQRVRKTLAQAAQMAILKWKWEPPRNSRDKFEWNGVHWHHPENNRRLT